jgi:hypothetical protein
VILGFIYILNIWIATRVAEASGRLPTPREPVSSMLYPRLVLPAAALALLGGMLPGYIGLALELFAVGAVLALAALGFAVLHDLTRGMAGRPFILGIAWTLTLAAGIPMLAMLMLGISELAFGWRARKRAGRDT